MASINEQTNFLFLQRDTGLEYVGEMGLKLASETKYEVLEEETGGGRMYLLALAERCFSILRRRFG